MKKYQTGFIVGKFSPLHTGHMFLVYAAQSMCERVVVLSYSNPVIETYDALERQYWFNDVFSNDIEHYHIDDAPANDVNPLVHRLFCSQWYEEQFPHENGPDAVFTSEDYGDGFASFMTDYFGRKVAHELVDLERKAMPVSATMLRDPNTPVSVRMRHMLHVVYSSTVPRVAVVGGESTGKTTLVNDVADALRRRGLRVGVAEEFGRTFGEWTGNKYTKVDLDIIATEHVRLERLAQQDNDIVLCDTTPMVTEWYSRYWFGEPSDRLKKLAKRKYNHTFLCTPTIPYVNDGTRLGDDFRQAGTGWQGEQLRLRDIPYTTVSGVAREQRVAEVIRTLEQKGLIK